MIGDAPLSIYTNVPGWESPKEQELLAKYAKTLQATTNYVEIGSEFGMSASIVRKFADQQVNVFCIDINLEAPFLQNLTEANLNNDRNHAIFGDSSKLVWDDLAYENGVPGDIDLLFIDGDHSYEGALKDLLRWTPYLRKGKCVILHDVAWDTNDKPHPLHFEVLKAVREWLQRPDIQFSFVEAADSMVVFRKV